ncbi:hypothetical protein QR685DRAFT_416591, partial [Neurospora intermedia]
QNTVVGDWKRGTRTDGRERNHPPPDVKPFAVSWDFLTSVKQVTFKSHYVNSQRSGYLSSLPDFRASAHGRANHLNHLA